MNITERMNHFNVPGVSVTYFDNAEIEWNKCFGVQESGTNKAVNENTIFHACSISKMITALCVLKLAQDGVLDINKDVNEYLTAWKIPPTDFTKERCVTISDLLAHQAGFVDNDGSFMPYRHGDVIPTPSDILKGGTHYSEEARPKYVPGTEFYYSDAGYCVIAQLPEDVLGETVPQIAKRLVFDPLKLTSTFFWEIGKDSFEGVDMANCAVGHDNDGAPVEGKRAFYPNIEGAALWATANDLARVAIDIVKSYHNEGGVVLSQSMAKLMLSPYGCKCFMGLGVFLDRDKNGQPYFFSQGWGIGAQCKLQVYFENKRGIVVMTNSEPGMEQDESLVGEIILQK